jgi:hypothetical protein
MNQLELIINNSNLPETENMAGQENQARTGARVEGPYINSSFSKLLPTLQLAWDSTSLGEFKGCQRRYKYTIIDGWVPREQSVHLRFGLEYHSALELYQHRLAAGDDHESALIESVKHALISTWDDKLNRPWISDNPNKNRITLIRSIIDYLDNFKNDSFKTYILANGKAAVELSFRLELDKKTTITQVECPICFGDGQILREPLNLNLPDHIDDGLEECRNCNGTGTVGETYILCGHFDRIAEFQEALWIPDAKTTKFTLNSAYFAKYSPDNQVSFYSYAGKLVFSEEIKGVIIDASQIKVESTEFERREIARSESYLAEWITDTEYYISLAEVAAERNHWPMNEKMCGQVYEDPQTGELSYQCPFRKVCAEAPEIRETLLKANYDKRVWDPLKSREKP